MSRCQYDVMSNAHVLQLLARLVLLRQEKPLQYALSSVMWSLWFQKGYLNLVGFQATSLPTFFRSDLWVHEDIEPRILETARTTYSLPQILSSILEWIFQSTDFFELFAGLKILSMKIRKIKYNRRTTL